MKDREFLIHVDPYNNKIEFKLKDGGTEWKSVPQNSDLRQYENSDWIFQNCVKKIVDIITDNYENYTIVFEGTSTDYEILCQAIKNSNHSINTIHCASYKEASEALQKIRKSYEKISEEFTNTSVGNDVEELIRKFDETVGVEIPVCIVGSYSVGKSAIINALIGYEILPSSMKSTTARNIAVRCKDQYKLRIKYCNCDYDIDVEGNKAQVTCVQGEKCKDEDKQALESAIEKTVEGSYSEENIIYKIISYFNQPSTEDYVLAHTGGTMQLWCPFRNSGLCFENAQYVICDTPGSNAVNDDGKKDKKVHRLNLNEVLENQTNALPILVMEPRDFEANDNKKLRELIEENREGISVNNAIIIVPKADALVEGQMNEDMTNLIKRRYPNSAILFVSAVCAIGLKKKDHEEWIDNQYKQVFEAIQKKGKLELSGFDKIPCGRSYSSDSSFFDSGIMSLEGEINFYASHYANYKKCVNARKYLLDAMSMAEESLCNQKNELNIIKEEKIKESNTKREYLMEQINMVKFPSVNSAVEPVRKRLKKEIDNYCACVEPVMREIWPKSRNGKDFESRMKVHCQENLYNKNFEKIVSFIRKELKGKADEYEAEVKSKIYENSERFSNECREQLDELFKKKEDSRPKFNPKSVTSTIELKGLSLLRVFEKIDNCWYKKAAQKFVDEIRGKSGKVGRFAKDCIQKPIFSYDKDLNSWRTDYIEKIKETIGTENAFLCRLDSEIKQKEETIDSLENRIERLSSVKEELSVLLDKEERNE